MKLIYEKSSSGRPGVQMTSIKISESEEIPSRYLRSVPPELPEVSEAEVVRHFTALSRLNYSIDTHFYPLGSCTMKYNPKACEAAANLPELTEVHRFGLNFGGRDAHTRIAGNFISNRKNAL